MQQQSAEASPPLLGPIEILELVTKLCEPAEAALLSEPNTTSASLSGPTGGSLRPPGDDGHEEDEAPHDEAPNPLEGLGVVESSVLIFMKGIGEVRRVEQQSHEALRRIANDKRGTIAGGAG